MPEESERQSMRDHFYSAWHKHHAKTPLQPLEALIVEVIEAHPEYHALLDDADAVHREFTPEDGQTNPFLHMGMHLALREQAITNRPPGARDIYRALIVKFGGDHEAEHQMMDCLGEALWNAQRSGGDPDTEQYLSCLRQHAGIGGVA
jgi:hypothetical protein